MNILIVDNDESTVETFKAFLNSRTDYEVDVAYGGKECLDKMEVSASYDLVILDIMMPRISGIDVCELMSRDKKLKNTPILLVSALPVASDAFRESLGKLSELKAIKDVLEKPVEMNDLLTKVKVILNK